MSISRWHAGKLIILWSWGGLFAGLALTVFVQGSVTAAPWSHLVALLVALVILLALSAITWRWLGGRESGTER